MHLGIAPDTLWCQSAPDSLPRGEALFWVHGCAWRSECQPLARGPWVKRCLEMRTQQLGRPESILLVWVSAYVLASECRAEPPTSRIRALAVRCWGSPQQPRAWELHLEVSWEGQGREALCVSVPEVTGRSRIQGPHTGVTQHLSPVTRGICRACVSASVCEEVWVPATGFAELGGLYVQVLAAGKIEDWGKFLDRLSVKKQISYQRYTYILHLCVCVRLCVCVCIRTRTHRRIFSTNRLSSWPGREGDRMKLFVFG